MEDKENQDKKSPNIIKQQITVPFLWEERPGAPKKDWKPKDEPLTPVPNPVKYIASVPFKWEEKPGTPLRCFAPESKEHTTRETVPENRSLPLPPAYFTMYDNDSDEESSYGDDYDNQEWMSELDFDALSIQSEESFCSAPSLLENRLTPRKAIPSAVPLQNPFIQQNERHAETASSPESNSSPSSCATRNTSLRGADFLQHLFPLYPPKSGFLDIENSSEQNGHAQYSQKRLPTLPENKKLLGELGHSVVIKRPLTLGELILASRRRSYRRKAVQMKKKNPQKDFKQNKPHGCFNVGDSGERLAKLFGKDLLTLKLS